FKKESFSFVNAVTVNEITTDKKRMTYYKNRLDVNIETLEGAALHYVALMENIPFLQLRAISNYIGERDKTRWMLKESITNLSEALKFVIPKVSSI
ncbi:MAG: hypothetical protein ABR503_01815, partial [Chitinophagaceae bacterium]